MDTKTKSLPLNLQDLGKPSLVALSYALRHPDTWPKGFVWNYGNCSTCAMGLAARLWSESIPSVGRDDAVSIMAREFAMPYTAAKSVFLGDRSWVPFRTERRGFLWLETWSVSRLETVTPEMVADQIDKYLAEAE